MTEDFQTKASKARARIKNTGRTIAIGGVAAAVLLISRRADRHSHIAFGPAMVAGAYLACLIFAAGSS
jgi:leader peptidase (prepilin peptidase)/N-methyltransferase